MFSGPSFKTPTNAANKATPQKPGAKPVGSPVTMFQSLPPAPPPQHPSLSMAPQAHMAQMIQALQTQPGLTPEALRMLLEDRRQKQAVQAQLTLSPSDIVGGSYRNPL